MRILIVDDENKKATEVKKVCKTNSNVKDEDIIIVPGVVEAIARMKEERYQLVITDMCLPESYGSDLIDTGGLELIRILNKDKRVYSPNEIIVLSSYENLVTKYSNEIKKESFDIVYYDDSSIEWREKILDKLKYLHRCEMSPKEDRTYGYDVALLTAIPVEKNAVKELAEEWNKVKIPGDSTIYYETKWDNGKREMRVISTSLTQMGMVAASTITSKLIYSFAPRYIIMSGIAAGVKEEYNVGDIIIPKGVKDYCSGKFTTPKEKSQEAINNPFEYFIPTASSIPTDADIINMVSESYEKELCSIYNKYKYKAKYSIPQIRTGDMATGDSVIQNSKIIEMMIKKFLRQADGIDMEAYGMYYASQQSINPKPIPICMKSISDFANKDKSDEHQEYAAFISAQFAKTFVTGTLFQE